MPDIPDFTNRKWQHQQSDAQLLGSILDGKGKQMPPFAGKIDREKARKLVTYVRSFGRLRAQVAREPLDNFEKNFRRLQNQFDRLQKQLEELSLPAQVRGSTSIVTQEGSGRTTRKEPHQAK